MGTAYLSAEFSYGTIRAMRIYENTNTYPLPLGGGQNEKSPERAKFILSAHSNKPLYFHNNGWQGKNKHWIKSYSIRSQGFHNDNDFIILIHREGKCNFTNQQICPLSPQNREEAELTTSLPSENAGSGTRHSRPSTLGGIHIINEPYGLK